MIRIRGSALLSQDHRLHLFSRLTNRITIMTSDNSVLITIHDDIEAIRKLKTQNYDVRPRFTAGLSFHSP